MHFMRARLVGLSALLVSIHLAACGLAMAIACDARDEHHGDSSSHECHVPAEQAHACPMHHESSSKPSSQSTEAPGEPTGPSLRCNCGASSTLDALLETAFVPGTASPAVGIPVPVGAVVMFVPSTLDEPSQVLSPPPRS